MGREVAIPKWSRIVMSCAVSLAVCVFLMLCVHPGDADDDWSIALYLSNRLPGTGLSLHINALLSQLIHALNTGIPRISWFFAFEYFTAWLAFSAIVYAALSFVRKAAGAVLVAFVMLYVLPYCISESNYTYVAGLASLAGGLLLVSCMGHEGAGRLEAIVGVFLLALGLMWRSKMFLMLLPFICIAFAWRLACIFRAQEQGARGVLLRAIAPTCIALVVCAGLTGYDALVWRADGWAQWRAYEAVRSEISDYPMPAYEEVAPELESLGVSENDYYLLRHWGNADSDTLNTALLEKVAALRIRPFSSVVDVVKGIWHYAKLCFAKWKFFAVVLFGVFVARYRSRSTYVVAALELLICAAMCTYFLLAGRLLPRVEDPAWACSLAMCVALTAPLACGESLSRKNGAKVHSDGRAMPLKAAATGSVAINVCAVCLLLASGAVLLKNNLPYASLSGLKTSIHQDTYASTDSLSQYMEAFPRETFVLESGVHTTYELQYGFRYLPVEGLAERVMPLGGWGSGSPFRKAQCELVGASNPFQALISSNETFLVSDEATSQRVLTFLHEHYNQNVTCIRIMKFPSEDGSIQVWKFVSPAAVGDGL